MKKIPRIFIDMDQVLVDFHTGVCDLFGVEVEDVVAAWPLGEWSILEPLSKVVGSDISLELFWQVIHSRGPQFWTGLKALPWMQELIKLVEEFCDEWLILSSPSEDHSSHAGKQIWLTREQHFGKRFNRFALTPHKYLFAYPGSLLIDDKEENCENFEYSPNGDGTYRKTGAQSILFPGRHNSNHTETEPIYYVRRQLEKISHLFQ